MSEEKFDTSSGDKQETIARKLREIEEKEVEGVQGFVLHSAGSNETNPFAAQDPPSRPVLEEKLMVAQRRIKELEEELEAQARDQKSAMEKVLIELYDKEGQPRTPWPTEMPSPPISISYGEFKDRLKGAGEEAEKAIVDEITDGGRLNPARYFYWANLISVKFGYSGSELEEQLKRLARVVARVSENEGVIEAIVGGR